MADWEDALVTGNGRQGALVYGTPELIRVTLSHERLFLPVQPPRDAPDTAAILPGLRALLGQGRWADAALAVCRVAAGQDPAYRGTVWIDPLIGAATLGVRPEPCGAARDLRRDVDTRTGVVTFAWRDDGGDVRLEVFASRACDAVLLRVTGRDARLELTPVGGTPPVPYAVTVDGLRLDAEFPAATWPGALTGYRVRCRGAGEGSVVPGGAVLAARTEIAGEPEHDVAGTFDDLLAAHVAVHGDLMGRFGLEVGDRRVEQLVEAGRYLIVSSSGERPPTLQGVWSGSWDPPWSSGWTVDGNLPAALAGLQPTGTPELLLPLFDLVDAVRDDLRHNARRLYGARGVLVPVHLSAHGRLNHFGPVWCQTFWTAGAGWLARLYVDHWRYTGDEVFLRERALPFLREAADFLLDFVQVRDGVATFAPSYSPENAPASTGSQATVDATMDVAVARDLLGNLLRLDPAHPSAGRWRDLLAALPAYRVEDGRLAEWIHPGLTDQPAHRHSSHLWPLWYEPDPLITGDPVVRAAAAAVVRDRLAWWDGDEADEMAYGLCQLGLAAAALGMADEALWTLHRLAERYWTGFVPRHNRDRIFNVDIAGGYPAVVAAMLLRGAHGRIDLLPALPHAWPRGSVTGLRARDAVTVHRLSWEPGLVEVTLSAARPVPATVAAPIGTAWSGVLDGQRTLRFSP